jgi:hypothetical protein
MSPQRNRHPESLAEKESNEIEPLHLVRHARPWAGHPRLKTRRRKKDVDGRDEARP